MLKRFGVAAFITATLCTPASAQNTLESLIKDAIERNPSVQESWHRFLASEHATKGASAGYKPTVDLESRYGYEWHDSSPRENFDGADARITLRQMLFDGFETRSDVERFTELQLVRYHQLLDTVEQTAFDTYQAYTDVIRRRELLKLAQQNLERHKEVFQQIADSVNAGVLRTADLEQVSGRLGLAESNVIIEKSNLHDVTARFLRIAGQLPGVGIEPFTPDESSLPRTFERTLVRAYENNPAFHAAIRNIHATESAVGFRKASMYPRLDLSASYGTQTYDDFGASNGRSDARVGIELQYNLYRGGRDRAAIKEAYQQTNVAKDLRDQECRDLRQTVQIAYKDIFAIEHQLPSLNQHRLSSERVVTAFRGQFNIGERTLLDVLDAENEAFQAKSAYVNALHDKNLALARTLTATGDWLSSLGVMGDGLPTLNDLGASPLPIDGTTACPGMTEATIDIDINVYTDVDTDGDGVPDRFDFCPGTPKGAVVATTGCTVEQKPERTFETSIEFSSGSSQITATYAPRLAEIAAFIRSNSNANVVIEGHASRVGSASFNQALSEERAEATAELLISQFGVQRHRLQTVGYGFDKPKATGNTPADHEINQRIEVRIYLDDERVGT